MASNHDNQLIEILSEIRQTQITQAGQLGRIEGQLEGLAGPDGRIKALEITNNRQWWLHAAVLPAMVILRSAALKYGVRI